MKAIHKIVIWFGGAVFLVVLIALSSAFLLSQSKRVAEAQKHSLIVLAEADSFLSSMIDAETGQRGYLLTGLKTYLAPYLVARNKIPGQLAALRRLTQDDPVQQHRLDEVARLVDSKMAELNQTIEMYGNQDAQGLQQLLRSNIGKNAMDNIRAEMETFTARENRLLAQRGERFNTVFRQLLILGAVAGLLVITLVSVSAYLVYRETQRRLQMREEANKALKEANNALRASEENLSVTLQSIGDAVMATDAEGRITLLNAIAERLTGWPKAEAIGRPVADIFHIVNQKTRQLAPIPVTATLVQGVIHGLANDTVLVARDGSECPIADSCAPIRNPDGSVIGAVLVFRDVSKEYAAQVSLRDSTTRIQTILNTVADGIITINAHGIVETVNPAAERLFGYAANEVVGQNLRMLMPEPYHSQHDSYIAHYCATGEARVIGTGRDVAGRHKNGNTFPMHLAVRQMWLAGQRHFIGSVHDLTERKQAEQIIVVAKEAAQQANRAKDSFLATMSHEIRTPLTGMLGMLEVLSMTPLDSEQDKTLQAAWDSARSLLRIVNDILDWSKIEAGKLALAPRSTSIPQLLLEVVNTYSRLASAKSLVLWQHTDVRLSAAHIVDPLRLSQVLNNFVSNAIKFTQRGEIELRAELLEQLDSGEKIRFSVKDSGIGIAKDLQPYVFKRFQQESADTARHYGGTGLGLSICLRLAELLDGQIELVSELGHGSTFSITVILPVSAALGEQIPTLSHVVRQSQVKPLLDISEDAPLVLAVDDHPINRDLLARQIRLLGLRAETAEDGQIALQMWRDGRFALVITDCHMPEMDGYTLTRAIRKIEAEERRPHTPVIAWTANALPEEGRLCQAAGMDELLVKPAAMALLKTTLAKWLSIAESDSIQPTPLLHDSDRERNADSIDYAALTKIVPDSAEHTQVLRDFQLHIRADYAQLLKHLEQGELTHVERTAHRMKGSSRMVGARDMANACAAIEEAVRDGDIAGVKAATTALDEAFGYFETHLLEAERIEKKT